MQRQFRDDDSGCAHSNVDCVVGHSGNNEEFHCSKCGHLTSRERTGWIRQTNWQVVHCGGRVAMPRLSDLFVLAALGVLTSCHGASPASDARKAVSTHSSPSHALPTATEEFRLRGECVRLGKKTLAAREEEVANSKNPYSRWTDYITSEEAHYDPIRNRCFVEIDSYELDKTRPLFKEFDRNLYDGQTDDLLADTRTVAAKDGIEQNHIGMVYVAHERKRVEWGGKLTGDAYTKADSEAEYQDTQQFISDLMADDPNE